jgi:DNA-binding FadR family transcriptional regulator
VSTDFFEAGAYRRDRTGAADRVLEDLRSRILSGALERGVRLPSEKELASYYEVSAPTIREAIRALSAMSMVEVRHGAGTFVVAESSALMTSAMTAVVELENIDLLSIFDLSETLYLQAASLAVDVASDEEIAGLRAAAERFESATDDDAFAAALEAFLKTLVGVSHNRLLEAISAYLIETQIRLARDAASRVPSAWKKIAGPLAAERLAIADALAGRDREQADEAVRVYMSRGRELVRRVAGDTSKPKLPRHLDT